MCCQLCVKTVAAFVQYIHCSDELIFAALLLLFVERRGLVFLEAIVALTDDSLDCRELARLLLDTHGEVWLLVFLLGLYSSCSSQRQNLESPCDKNRSSEFKVGADGHSRSELTL
jgi:hypothetical protein